MARTTAPATLDPITASMLMGLGPLVKETVLEEELANSEVSTIVCVPVLPRKDSYVVNTAPAAAGLALEGEVEWDKVEEGAAGAFGMGVPCLEVVGVATVVGNVFAELDSGVSVLGVDAGVVDGVGVVGVVGVFTGGTELGGRTVYVGLTAKGGFSPTTAAELYASIE